MELTVSEGLVMAMEVNVLAELKVTVSEDKTPGNMPLPKPQLFKPPVPQSAFPAVELQVAVVANTELEEPSTSAAMRVATDAPRMEGRDFNGRLIMGVSFCVLN